ncbi:Glutathione S-transferase [Macrophomina phaseolina MS6]|uniref:Glutathione S-transferase n=1 Tax=Macrophomina phaseolina (strain MS6) TaxID=1126212 RepID=K2RHJ0_MACPH|nr:Glutathione S-transferase [Macrophomina phaseolina MS6]
MTCLQPIILHSHKLGPNPWKVALILEELGLPYESKYLEFSEAKQEAFKKLNPNGKLPVIEDPNSGLTLFESGAIIEYLIDQYDKDARLHRTSLRERYLERAWLHFQMSAQGPSCGSKVWLGRTYAEADVACALEYFTKEIKRIIGVLDEHLRRTGDPYLVGQMASYADLAFVPMYLMIDVFVPGYSPAEEFPYFGQWLDRLLARPAVQKVVADKKALVAPR